MTAAADFEPFVTVGLVERYISRRDFGVASVIDPESGEAVEVWFPGSSLGRVTITAGTPEFTPGPGQLKPGYLQALRVPDPPLPVAVSVVSAEQGLKAECWAPVSADHLAGPCLTAYLDLVGARADHARSIHVLLASIELQRFVGGEVMIGTTRQPNEISGKIATLDLDPGKLTIGIQDPFRPFIEAGLHTRGLRSRSFLLWQLRPTEEDGRPGSPCVLEALTDRRTRIELKLPGSPEHEARSVS